MAPTKATARQTGDTRKTNTPAHPITTKDKIAKAAAQAAKAAPRVKPANTKAPKPRSFPPPGEGLADLELEKPKGVKKRATKPLTTQQKIWVAQAAKEAKESKAKAAAAPPEAISLKIAPSAKAKGPPAMMDVLRTHSATVYTFAAKRSDIMNRRTQRSERYLRERREAALGNLEMQAMWEDRHVQEIWPEIKKDVTVLQKLHSKKEARGVEVRRKIETLVHAGVITLSTLVGVDGKVHAAFRLQDLPDNVRATIFSLVVVEPKIFIRPANSKTGREQPDLAMVSRKVRGEVLPLFYGRNTFAIDISPSALASGGKLKSAAKKQGGRLAPEFAAVSKWAGEMEKGGWFGTVKRWVFDYSPPESWQAGGMDGAALEDSSVMVSVAFARRPDKGNWEAIIEIHREAACIMPGFCEHGLCVVGCVPAWLNEAVIQAVDAIEAEGGRISGSTIVGLAKVIKARVLQLGEVRCKQRSLVRSIEMDSEENIGVGSRSAETGSRSSIGTDSGFGGD
ncbi:hypothetical protein LTR08_007700 [Meristemomyces frigidus]|nr:hypothetical protein LTR08_007700 [Meristemomyces frigidus]